MPITYEQAAALLHPCFLPHLPTFCCAPQVRQLFPSARNLNVTWHSIVKIGQSLYREAPGMDPYRPDQATPVPNFFLAGSYTKQVGDDSMQLRAGGGAGGSDWCSRCYQLSHKLVL